jgi:hypothetical protein
VRIVSTATPRAEPQAALALATLLASLRPRGVAAPCSGRLVFDLDESETTPTLDAPFRGVHYTIPFERVRSIVLPGGGGGSPGRVTAAVILGSGEQLRLEEAGDLGPENGGMLIFPGGGERAEYVAWRDVARIDFDGRDPPRLSR